MRKRRVVITQLGTVNSLGFGREEFWHNLLAGRSGQKPLKRFDLSRYQSKTGSFIEIDLDEFLNERGVKRLDRNTKLILSTIKRDLKIATESNTGVVIGTIFGSLEIVSNFDKITLLEGPKSVSPTDFSLSVINAATSQANISYGLHALSTTVSTGFNAGIDAIGYAYQYIQRQYLDEILCGGSEELCEDFYRGMASQHLLSTAESAEESTGALTGENAGEAALPFDRRRNGCILGEGCGLLVLQAMESALAEEQPVLAEVVGFATVFDSSNRHSQASSTNGFYRAMRGALADAGLNLSEVQWIVASANGWADDRDELQAIDQLAREEQREEPIYVSTLKGQLGECGGATGAIQIIGAIQAMRNGKILPTVGMSEPEFTSDLIELNTEIVSANVEYIMVNSKGLYGNYSSIVLKKYSD